MAHELEITADGRASFVYVGASAWHNLGQQVPEGITVTEAGEQARVNYPVEVQELYRKITVGAVDGIRSDDYIPSKVAKATVRTDTGVELGRVSPDYTAVQNVDAFRVLEPLVEAGIARVETAGVLRGGQDAWMLLQLRPSAASSEAASQLGVAPYILVRNNHSGRAGILFQSTVIRVVCANTLALSEGMVNKDTSAVIRHTGAAEARLVERASAILTAMDLQTATSLRLFDRLRHWFLDEALFRHLVLDVAAPLPIATPERPVQAHVRQRAEEKRARISYLWAGGKGHTGDQSAWEAYNAVVEHLDHDQSAYGGLPQNRLASLVDGAMAETRTRVLSGLLRYRPESITFAGATL